MARTYWHDPAVRLPYTPDLPVRTERLMLREFRPDDYDALMAFHSDPGNVLYVPFEARTPESMQVALERKLGGTSLGLEARRGVARAGRLTSGPAPPHGQPEQEQRDADERQT
jgi:hypothetical protein